MEVRDILGASALILMISSCSESPKMTQATAGVTKPACTGAAAIKSKVIVEWENGDITFEKVDDISKFKNEFLRPQIDLIRRVQYDQKIQFHPQQMQSTTLNPLVVQDDWGQQMIQLNQLATATAAAGDGITVAVVDSFVDVTHIQLKGQIAINTGEIPNNGIDDDGNGVIDDYLGASFVSQSSPAPESEHGTHVSGIIAADPNKGPIRGVAPKARLVPSQFIGNDGSGSLSDAIRALEYAASRGAKVVNASWGGAPCTGALATEFNLLEQKGILLIVAAGNDGADLDSRPTYPAAFNVPNQITVAASTPTDFMASFSNSSFDLVHIAAPGVSIKSTIPGNQTAFMDGTSMATPFVTGAAALLWSARPQATAQEIRNALLTSVDVFPQHEFRVSSQGRLNVYKAYQQLKSMIP